MKTLLLSALALFTFATAGAQTTVKQKTKTEQKAAPVVKKTSVKTTHLKKDGTPDRRYKENKKLKKDGTPDMRYKENRTVKKTETRKTQKK